MNYEKIEEHELTDWISVSIPPRKDGVYPVYDAYYNNVYAKYENGIWFAVRPAFKLAQNNTEISSIMVDKDSKYKQRKLPTLTTIDFTKPVETVEGIPVTIISNEGRGEYNNIGYVDNDPILRCWTNAGIDDYYPTYNLQNTPEKIKKWLNIYSSGHGFLHDNKQDAYTVLGIDRIACIEIEFEKGQGL